jgi:hypothetical protein
MKYIREYTPEREIEVTKETKEHALIQILPRVEYYADLMQISHLYTNVKTTSANTKR